MLAKTRIIITIRKHEQITLTSGKFMKTLTLAKIKFRVQSLLFETQLVCV